jgi:replicative DNA helicase
MLEESLIDREQMAKQLAKTMKVREDTILQELDRVANTRGITYHISQSEILWEKKSLERAVTEFENWAWSRSGMLGLKCGFPILDEKLEGIQDAYHIIAGETNIGKSAMLINLAYGLITNNPNKVYVLYLSLDDNFRKTLPRFVALHAGIPINMVKNPSYNILMNDKLSEEEKKDLVRKRCRAMMDFGAAPPPVSSGTGTYVPEASPPKDIINNISNTNVIDNSGLCNNSGIYNQEGLFKNNLSIKDDSNIRELRDIEKIVQSYITIAGDKKLVLMIDNLHKITIPGYRDFREMFVALSKGLKHLVDVFNIPLVATAELRKLNSAGSRPTLNDIKETGSFAFDADVILLLYNELKSCGSTPLKFTEVGTGTIYPILEVSFAKNKVGDYIGKIYYRFYTNLSKVVECSYEEQQAYEAMVRKGV